MLTLLLLARTACACRSSPSLVMPDDRSLDTVTYANALRVQKT